MKSQRIRFAFTVPTTLALSLMLSTSAFANASGTHRRTETSTNLEGGVRSTFSSDSEPSSRVASPASFELWGGPGARDSGVSTFLTIADGKAGSGSKGTIEYRAAGVVVATETLEIAAKSVVRHEAPAALDGKGPFMFRMLFDQPVSAWTQTRAPRGDVASRTFGAHETLSAGDTAIAFGASTKVASTSAASSQLGLMCLPRFTCKASLILLDASGNEVGKSSVVIPTNALTQDDLANLVPDAADRDGLALKIAVTAGRLMPFLVTGASQTPGTTTSVPFEVDRKLGSTLDFPLGCQLSRDCWVANYVDRGAVADYMGGALTYSGHDGIDYLINGFSAMDLGVDVLAAANGRVIDVVDGNFDRCTGECGDTPNYVMLEHADTSITLYLHLKKSSIIVSIGDVVARGQKMGEVGSSGRSTDPHLHFSYIPADKDDAIDPFVRPEDERVSPWLAPAQYQGFEATQIARVVFSSTNEIASHWSVDPHTQSTFAKGMNLSVTVFGLRFQKSASYQVRVLDMSGHEVSRAAVPVAADYPEGALNVTFPNPFASGAPGDWVTEISDGDRILSRRKLAVN